MEIIFGALSLTIGLVAIWLANTASNHVEIHGDLLLQAVRKTHREETDTLKNRLKTFDEKCDSMLKKLNSHETKQEGQ